MPDEAKTPGPVKTIPKPTNPWPFFGVIIVLCIAGWLLVQWMSDSTHIQDCVMSGKKNCGERLDPALGR